MKIATSEQMRELDRKTIEECGVPGIELMEKAGKGAFEQILRAFPRFEAGTVSIVCGRGNNGGDGYVVARHLLDQGAAVKVYLLSEKDRVRGDALLALEALEEAGGGIEAEVLGDGDLPRLRAGIDSSDLVVDAILGTGLKKDVAGVAKEAIEIINASGKPVAALDIPSGVDATTGHVLGSAVTADLTVTFGLAKIGQSIYPGAGHVGQLEIVDIGIPDEVVEASSIKAELMDRASLAGILRPRDGESHKGRHGHLLVLAGSTGKTGAATLTCMGAARVGTGLITLGIPKSINPIMEMKLTEVMTETLPEEADLGTLSKDALDRVFELSDGKSALAIGPGISTRFQVIQLIHDIVRRLEIPMVLDADAITAVSREPSWLKNALVPVILTPHPGEMSRLAGIPVPEVQADRIGVAREFATANKVILVLKGARTVIAFPDGTVSVNPTGNPGMATGGMGDVLTGMVAGFLAQGYDPADSARLGVYLHGLAGDRAAERIGPVGILAGDLLPEIPGLIGELAG